MRVTRRELLSVLAVTASTGCSSQSPGRSTRSAAADTPVATDTLPPEAGRHVFTHYQPTGNRVIAGQGGLPTAEPVDVKLDLTPRWLVGAGVGTGTAFVAVSGDGRVRGITFDAGEKVPLEIDPDSLPTGMPPVLDTGSSPPGLVKPPRDASPTAGVLPLDDGTVLFVDRDGSVGQWDGTSVIDSVSVDAIPDARIVEVGPDRAAVLTGATTRYDHGVLGDGIEADRVTMLETRDGLSIDWHARPEGGVIEGQAPIIADLAGDGRPTVIVTASDSREGARIVSFGLDGRKIAVGPAIGTGFRWRHQLAVAPFSDDGTPELAVVRTPHIGGRLEFYRLHGDRLSIVATRDGYSSHTIGSRNLDTTVAGDFDGDGRPEIVVPRNDHGTVAGVARSGNGTGERWNRTVGAPIASNLAAARRADGTLVLGVGRSDGSVRLWA